MSIKELEARHTSGEKQIRSVQSKIDQQLKRTCALPGCEESLAFARADKLHCSDKHKRAHILLKRAQNRAKKRRYYEKHGITFNKTIRNRNAKPALNSRGVEYNGQALLYENYKEPLKPVEKDKGYGYYGTLGITEDGEYVQCHICGNLYPAVGYHLRKHKISAYDYKERFGLAASTGLVSEPERARLQEKALSSAAVASSGNLPVWLQEYNRKVQSGEIKHTGNKRREGGMPLEKRNKLDMCPEQVLEKIKILADKLGHTPSEEEFIKHYNYRYYHSIRFQHGSYLKAVAKLGMKSAKELKEPDESELILSLQEFFKKHGRVPMGTDFARGLVGWPRQMYWRRFGTLNNARVEAGLPALLPLPFGKQIMMSPDEYIKYKEGIGLSRHAINGRKRRAARKLVHAK